MKHDDADDEWWVKFGTPEHEAVTKLCKLLYRLEKAESLDKIKAILNEEEPDE